MFIQVSQNLKKLSKFFPENLYVVGGFVRNKLLSLSESDVDIASSVDPQTVLKRLEGSEFSVKVKNIKLGSLLITCNDETYEYTPFRKEIYENPSHYPTSIEFVDKVEEDAKRRDFTINSIYYNINKDECVDIFHGVTDLTQRLVRATSEEILKHDGERILRMVRIAGELDFKIEKNTLKNAILNAKNVQDLSGERKYLEIDKILNCEKRYNKKNNKKALKLLNVLGVWKYFGFFYDKVNYKMCYKTDDRFLGLLIDIVDTQKPSSLQTFLETFLKEQFGLNASQIKRIFILLAGYYDALNGMKNKEYFFKYFENYSEISPLLKAKSKHIQNKYNFFYSYIIEHQLVIKSDDLKISEEDIARKFPSIDKRSYSRILKNLLSKVFDGKLKNEKQSLLNEIEINLKNF